jgi:hypothetical protein
MNTNNKKRKVVNVKKRIGFFKLNVFLSIFLAFILLILTNFCASRIYVRYHYDSLMPKNLSKQSLDILRETRGELTIISLFERSHPFRKPARRLLKEYQEISEQIPNLNIKTQCIDANLDITETAAILKKYDVEVNSIIIIRGLEYHCITEAELSGNPTSLENQSNPASQFIGEAICTLSIHKLLRKDSSKIYFLSGHGEYDPTSADRNTGASNFAHLLELYDNNVEVLNLNTTKKIPVDCDVLVIADPTVVFSEIEVNIISTYLNNGGRTLFLFDSFYAGGLGPLLNLWNIQIIPPQEEISSKVNVVSTTIYSQHEITEPLANIATTFSSPHFLAPASDIHLTTTELADKPQFSPLIVEDPANNKSDTPKVIAAAIQLGKANELGKKQNTRIVICGDASIISNAMIGQGISGNKLFLFSAIEWLKGKENTNKMIPAYTTILNSGISPKEWPTLLIRLGVLLPIAILLTGIILISPILKRI